MGEGQLHVMPYTAYYPWTDCHGSKITAVDLQGDIIVVGQCSAIFVSNFCFIFRNKMNYVLNMSYT